MTADFTAFILTAAAVVIEVPRRGEVAEGPDRRLLVTPATTSQSPTTFEEAR
jgi:hypothetical protein